MDNVTAIGTGIMTIAMDAGSKAASTEPYSYFIAMAVALAAIGLGLGFLLKRRGGKKGKR